MSNPRKKYDQEFKKHTVRMSDSSERPVTAVAESPGVTSNMIYRWRKSTPRTETKRNWPSSRTSLANFASGELHSKKASAFFAKNQK